MTYEDIRHVSTLISPGPTRSAERAGTTVGRLDARHDLEALLDEPGVADIQLRFDRLEGGEHQTSGGLEPVHRSAGGHVERPPRRDDLPASPRDEGHLAVDDEAPVGAIARSLERRPGRTGAGHFGKDVGHRPEHREPDGDPVLANGLEAIRRDVHSVVPRVVACR